MEHPFEERREEAREEAPAKEPAARRRFACSRCQAPVFLAGPPPDPVVCSACVYAFGLEDADQRREFLDAMQAIQVIRLVRNAARKAGFG